MQSQPSSGPSKKRVKVAQNLWRRVTSSGEVRFEDIRVHDGKQRQTTLKAKTLTEAKRAQRELVVGLEKGTVATPSKVTYGEVAQEFLAEFEGLVLAGTRQPESLSLYPRRYRLYLEPSLGRVPVQKVSASHLSAVYRGMPGRGLSENTCSAVARLNSSIEDLAVTRGYIAERPSKRLARAFRPTAVNRTHARVLSGEEGRALAAAAEPAWRTFVEFLLGTGCRLGEAMGLKWGDVDLQEGVLHVRQQKTPEGAR